MKNRTLQEVDPEPLPTAKMEIFCDHSLQLKTVYYNIATRSSILNIGRGPRPAFDDNGVL